MRLSHDLERELRAKERARKALAQRVTDLETDLLAVGEAMGFVANDATGRADREDRLEYARRLRSGRDALARDLDGARAEWRHHIERIADAIECEVSVKDEHGVLARKVAEAAKELHSRSLVLLHEVERERGIVDALVRKAKESEET